MSIQFHSFLTGKKEGAKHIKVSQELKTSELNKEFKTKKKKKNDATY